MYKEELEEKSKDWEDDYADIEIKKLSQKVMLAHELGIVEFLRLKAKSEAEIGRMLGAIMSERSDLITKLINAIKNDNKNNPYRNKKNESWLKDMHQKIVII